MPADDIMRFIAHHLLNIFSRDPLFSHVVAVPEGSDLSMEIAPLLAAKRQLGEDESLQVQLQLDKDLPAHERIEAVSSTILAWEPNLSFRVVFHQCATTF